MNAREFLSLKETADRLRKDRDRAEGEARLLERQLMDAAGASSVGEVRDRLAELKAGREEAEREAEVLLKKFRARWGDKLKGSDA